MLRNNHCVCCGEEIPEGRMICRKCEISGMAELKDVFRITPEQTTALEILQMIEEEKDRLLSSKKILSSKGKLQLLVRLADNISNKYFNNYTQNNNKER